MAESATTQPDAGINPDPDRSLPVGISSIADAAHEVLRQVQDLIAHQPLPSSTYRVQFQQQFTFRDATEITPYLHELGITHVYCSPYLKARRGSVHGYDVVDHTKLHPELGTEQDFAEFVATLRAHGMGHIVDFVPNHMGIGSDENAWWQDVLENGPSSAYASFFDVDWQPLKSDLKNKVLLPVLGEQFGKVLEDQQLVLHFAEGTLFLTYAEHRFPIAPRSYFLVLKHRLEELQRRLGDDHPHLFEYQSIVTAIGHLPAPDESNPERIQERQREKEVIKRRLQRLCDESPLVLEFVRENVAAFNGRIGEPHTFDLLDSLLNEQAYRLSYWRVAADEVNYRRFFDVNELAAVCMENPEVFEKTHLRVMQLLQSGQLDGLRIDHADGLYDPTEYLWQLQKHRFLQLCRQVYQQACVKSPASTDVVSECDVMADMERRFEVSRRSSVSTDSLRPLYVVVEKILEGQEPLPADWPVYGTTGYEFLNLVNGLFVRASSAKSLASLHQRFTGENRDFDELVYESKRLIMRVSLAGELNVLAHQLDRISERNRRSRDFTENGLKHALREIVACFPVYRTYTTPAGVLERDRKYIEQAVVRAKRRNPADSHAVFDFVRDVLLLRLGEDTALELRTMVDRFIGRFQQFTSPLMAKSVEDTAYYIFHRLVSLNEVGGDPRRFGVSVDEFHAFNRARWQFGTGALSATATHDTKRGEDTRARINVLSEVPVRWKEHVLRWARWNRRKKTKIDGELAPSRADEYLLYQTLVGSWPFEAPRGEQLNEYITRIQQYMLKAQREAKVHSSWITPNEVYEQATQNFISAILTDEPVSGFRTDFEPFAREIAVVGIWNSLSQTLLKLTSPGVPDIYQGTELWDFHLVDPDNRRLVDYSVRRQMLAILRQRLRDVPNRAAEVTEYANAPMDGRIKLFLVSEVLRCRREFPRLFAAGEYVPLEISGEGRHHLCAFARRDPTMIMLVVVSILNATLLGSATEPPVGLDVWRGTSLALPGGLDRIQLRDWFTHREWTAESSLSIAEILGDLPVALLVGHT